MLLRIGAAVPEAIAFVAGFDDVAVMRETVEQGRGHLCIAEYTGPFAEVQIRRDGHARVLV